MVKVIKRDITTYLSRFWHLSAYITKTTTSHTDGFLLSEIRGLPSQGLRSRKSSPADSSLRTDLGPPLSLRHILAFIMASPQRVMITGGNGFVGYGVLVGLLKAGVSTLFGNYSKGFSCPWSFSIDSRKCASSKMWSLMLIGQ